MQVILNSRYETGNDIFLSECFMYQDYFLFVYILKMILEVSLCLKASSLSVRHR